MRFTRSEIVRIALLIIIACSLVAVASSCEKSRSKAAPATPRQGDSIKAAAGDVGRAAALIDKERAAIVQEAPDTKPHTDAIGDQTDKLRATQAQLDESQKTVRANEKACEDLRTQVSKLTDENAKLRDSHNTLIKWALALLAVASVVGAAACFWSANVRLGGFCATLFAVSIAAEYLIQWAVWFGLGIAVALALCAVYLVIVKHMHLKEIVAKGKDLGTLTPATSKAVSSIANRLGLASVVAGGVWALLIAVPVCSAQPFNVITGHESVTLIAPYRTHCRADVLTYSTVEFVGDVTQPGGPGTDNFEFDAGSGVTIFGPCWVGYYLYDPVIGNFTSSFFWAGPGDFNADGDVGTDQDIVDFFSCLSSACASADFDGDGDAATDADIECFFRVLSGGEC